ncbi:MAG: preprotein translocase subunit SecY [Clostridia bacterium]|nr:preprotein translocase subunit SecY [Clostridia bacterium]
MFRTLANAWKIEDLRKKLLFTALILLIYRIGAVIPLPFLKGSAFQDGVALSGGSALGFVNILSGNAFQYGTLFALGVSPYITASIVMQLLTVAIPPLERLAKRGEEGKEKIAQYTRYVTIALSIITGIGYYMLIAKQWNMIHEGFNTSSNWLFFAIVIVACLCAGSSVVMWLAEKINEKGIGNGISLILFANIISRLPVSIAGNISSIIANFKSMRDGTMKVGAFIGSLSFIICYALLILALVWFIIFITDSERRIPVQYAKKVVGRKMYGGQSSNLPIKLNMTGVMPIIFASTILSIPSTIMMFTGKPESGFWLAVANQFDPSSQVAWTYAIIQFLLIIAFAYFYTAISFNPIEVSGNLQKNGGAIPGIRPGKNTSDFIAKVLSRITLLGALFLSIICVLPLLLQLIFSLTPIGDYTAGLANIAFGGTSIMIVVGVILETVREIEAQMTMRHYKGFLE